MPLTQQVQGELPSAHDFRYTPHPWIGRRSPASVMKPNASAENDRELTELLVGIDVL